MNNKKSFLLAIVTILALVATAAYAVTTVGNNVSIGGTLGVTGATTLSSTLSVTGNTVLTGSLTANGDVTLGDAATDTVTVTGAIASPLTLKQTTANYTLQWSDPAAARTLTIPDPGANDTFVFLAATQTLTNKTLTSPTINGGTIDNATIGGTTPAAGTFTTATATTLTDGTASLSGGNLTGMGNITFSGSPTLAINDTGTLTVTDGTNTLLTVTDAGTTGNLSVTGNLNVTGTGTIDGVDVSAITAMKSSYGSGTDPGVGSISNVIIDQFQVTAARTLTRIDGYCQTAYTDGETGDAGYIVLQTSTPTDVATCQFTSGANSVACSGLSVALSPGTDYQLVIRTTSAGTTTAPTAAKSCNITLHLEQK